MIVNLLVLFSLASAYKYLPDVNQPKYGTTSHNHLHKYTANISSIPHHVLIVYGNLYCSGALVMSRVVVTAASCFHRRSRNTPVIVKVGSEVVTDLGQVVEVLDIKTHEYFGHNTERNNDIAILVLKEHVVFNDYVQKIILVEPEVSVRVGTTLEVSGWGGSNLKQKYSNILLWSEMVVMDRDECRKVYKNLITSSNFCVRYQPEQQLSDNGGPAEYADLLVGIISFGAVKSEERYVAVLTNISYFNRWIMLNSKRYMKKYCVQPIYNFNNSQEDWNQDYTM